MTPSKKLQFGALIHVGEKEKGGLIPLFSISEQVCHEAKPFGVSVQVKAFHCRFRDFATCE